MTTHAVLSASAAARWIPCPGSVALSAGKVDSSSVYADWGTAAHELASWCLTGEHDAAVFLGRKIAAGTRYFTVDTEMAECVQTYVNVVREYVANTNGQLLVEQRVDYSAVIGVPDSFGTADAIILAGDELIVIDLKTGQGEHVDATENYQLRMYALGALEDYSLVSDFTTVRLVISQPRVSRHPSEHIDSVGDLLAFARLATKQGQIAMLCLDGAEDPMAHLEPGEKQCRWCRAKATCPKLRDEVFATVSGKKREEVTYADFEDLTAVKIDAATPVDQLVVMYEKRDLVKSWLEAVIAEALSRGEEGNLPGYKMVAGKRGSRAWTSEEEAEAALKGMRLKVDEMYDFKLISPTKAEKLLKENPRKWKKVLPLISQSEGKPTLVPESDKREAIKRVTDDDFETIAPNNDDLV